MFDVERSFPSDNLDLENKNLFFLVPCRPPGDFDSCVMEQCNEMENNTLDTSFNATNPSLQSSRLSTSNAANVSFLKRRLFEDEDDEDVSLLPEDDDPHQEPIDTVTSTQRPKSPPRCDSETEVKQNNNNHE